MRTASILFAMMLGIGAMFYCAICGNTATPTSIAFTFVLCFNALLHALASISHAIAEKKSDKRSDT